MIMSHWTGTASVNLNSAGGGEMKESDQSLPACAEELVDGKLALNVSMSGADKEPMHTGKWSQEEMEYAEGLIDEFKAGNLALPDGFSLRQFLAKMLNCSPKRISKRYEGNNYSKGRKFYVKSSEKLSPQEAKIRRDRLNELERNYKHKLMQLKMPHLMVANRTSESDTESAKLGQGLTASQQAMGFLRSNLSHTVGAAGTTSGQSGAAGILGLGDGMTEQAFMNAATLQNYLRLDSTNVLQRSLALNPQGNLLNSRSSGLTAGLLDANAWSRSVDDASTLALLQQRESQRLSVLLDAQRRLNSNALLRANSMRMQPNPYAQSSLMGDQASSLLGSLSNSTRRQSLDSELSQQLRLRQMLEVGQLQMRNAGEQAISLPYAALSQTPPSAAALLSNESLSGQAMATFPLFSAAQQARNADDQLQSLLALQSAAAELGGARGQKRRASESQEGSNSSAGEPRQRLA